MNKYIHTVHRVAGLAEQVEHTSLTGQVSSADGKVKTKAKKKKYVTGAHGSGSAMQKAKYREQRTNRHKK